MSAAARTPQESVAGAQEPSGPRGLRRAATRPSPCAWRRSRAHPVYGKTVRSSSKLHAHDERNEAAEGDLVRVVECRPLSRQKRWRLVEIIEKAR